MFTINFPAYRMNFSAKASDIVEARAVAQIMARRYGWATVDASNFYEAYRLDQSGETVELCVKQD